MNISNISEMASIVLVATILFLGWCCAVANEYDPTNSNALDGGPGVVSQQELTQNGFANALKGVLGNVVADQEQGSKWFQIAASNGNVQAQMLLGIWYQNGVKLPKSASENS